MGHHGEDESTVHEQTRDEKTQTAAVICAGIIGFGVIAYFVWIGVFHGQCDCCDAGYKTLTPRRPPY